MKTLAVIKNELFKDYLRFVSTSDLPSVLDNPDIPVPFTCVEAVENQNSDALMGQLKNYFNNSKVNNKDFYTLDEDNNAQLQFMLNLIKLSSGQPTSPVEATAPVVVSPEPAKLEVKEQVSEPVQEAVVVPVVESVVSEPVTTNSVVVNDTVAQSTPEEPTKVETPVQELTPVVQETIATQPALVEAVPAVQKDTVVPVAENVVSAPQEDNNVFAEEDSDPFGFKTAPVVPAKAPVQEVAPLETPVVEEAVVETVAPVQEEVKQEVPSVEMVASLGIPKGSVIQFIKDEGITGTLVDDKTVSYENQNMTLAEAAKAAFKKSGTVGMAVGLSNWNFQGETLKAWKEKQLN